MINENKQVFDDFKTIHDKYILDENKWQDELNKKGKRVQELVREYEDRLCRNTERGMYNKFSTGLSEKFQNEVKHHFPMIDHIGLIVEKFSIKKISLS